MWLYVSFLSRHVNHLPFWRAQGYYQGVSIMTLWQYRNRRHLGCRYFYRVYHRLQGTSSCKKLRESWIDSSYAQQLLKQIGMWALYLQRWLRHKRNNVPPLHNVLDPMVCVYFRPSTWVIGLKHDAERGNLVPLCIPLSEHHEHLDMEPVVWVGVEPRP